MNEKELALEGIRKKLVGKRLNYKEIYAIMDQITEDKLGDVLTTYFVASGYSQGFSSEEIFYLTRAMVETGETLHFRGVVADKHSIGGSPGTRTTLIVVPIVAAAGFKIPKSSSRAITSPAGTADCMEVLCRVDLDKEKIYKIVEEVGGCIVWGGSFKIAPADDEIIKIEAPILFESYDKIIVSVMAKKIAFGSNHIVIDLPYGETAKVHRVEDAIILKEKFKKIAEKFNQEIKVYVHKQDEPLGRGVGALLETKDALKVLEQKEDRPLELEERALELSSILLSMCLADASDGKKREIKEKYASVKDWTKDLLVSGVALAKFQEIVKAQGGKTKANSDLLIPGSAQKNISAKKSGRIVSVNNKNITIISKILGAPADKLAGIYLYKRIGEKVEKGEDLLTLYSNTEYNLKEALDSVESFPIFKLT